jgi:predicted permease
VNVANLLLVSAVRRRREFVIRRALGCSGRRLFRQLLAEHLLLVLLGGAAGILVTVSTMPLVGRLLPPSLPRGDLIRVDLGVLAFAATTTAIAGLLSGCLPAWVARGSRFTNALQTAGSVSPTERRLTSVLVMSETALVLVLLAGAGLLASSVSRLGALELGFNPSDVVTMQIKLPERLANRERASDFEQDLLLGVRSLPGVERAATSDQLPFTSGSLATVSVASDDVRQPSLVAAVDPEYFSVLGVAPRRGRLLRSGDRGRTDVAVVNETLAGSFPEGRALGGRIRVGGQWREVVGVTADTTELGQVYGSAIRRSGALARLTLPSAYVPSGTASTPRSFFLVLRSARPPAELESAVRRQISEVDSEVSIRRTTALEARIDDATAGVRFQMLLAWVFAGVSLVLATVGLHSVLAQAVGQRTSEIGLRVALGASRRQIRWLITRRAVAMMAAGLAIGLTAVVVGSQAMRSFLFEVSPLDPGVLAAAVVVLLAGAAVGAHSPVRRATRVDPAVALRRE